MSSINSKPTLSSESKASLNPSITHQTSYNQLLNLKTSLLHLQYLYCNLSSRLQTQHKNQQLQHKDHLIQCFNVKQELDQVKKDNFMMLWIVKLEEMLAIQQQCNQKLLQNNNYLNNNTNPRNKVNGLNNPTPKWQGSEQSTPLSNLSLVQKLQCFIELSQHQMQQSLCKLYIGKNVLIDLDKISSQINKIQNKIDKFLTTNTIQIEKYNRRIADLDQIRNQYLDYLGQVAHEVTGLIRGTMIQGQQYKNKPIQTINHSQLNSNNYKFTNNKHKQYQRHVQDKLYIQQRDIQQRIKIKRQSLTIF